jgi:hypothetical protein
MEERNGNAKLWALIRKKGKRDMSNFKKAFGKDPDFPSVHYLRKVGFKKYFAT